MRSASSGLKQGRDLIFMYQVRTCLNWSQGASPM